MKSHCAIRAGIAEKRERLKWKNKKQLFTLYIDGMPKSKYDGLPKIAEVKTG